MLTLLILYKASLTILMFLLFFICIRSFGLAVLRRRSAQSRLSGIRKQELRELPARLLPLYRHLKEMMEAARFIRSVGTFMTVSVLLALAGVAAGVLVFRSLRGVFILSLIWGLMPYGLLRLKLISGRLRTRLEFLPAVEVFYQQVVLTNRPNIRSTLQAVVAGDRLLYPIKPSFEQLHRNLAAGVELEAALRIFGLELGHIWADYFINMLRMAVQEGVDITPNLKELIEDMRRAQLHDQRARNRLLEIRLASFSPCLFLLLFLFINLKLDYDNAVYYYFVDSGGRNLLLNAILLLFGSFTMGIYLSMKRM